MFRQVAKLTTRSPKKVLIFMAVLTAVAGLVGSQVFRSLSGGGFEDDRSQSVLAENRLTKDFGVSDSNLIILLTAKNGVVDDVKVSLAAGTLEASLRDNANIKDVISYWSSGRNVALRSTDGRSAFILGTILGNEDEVSKLDASITPAFTVDNESITTAVGGFAEINRQYHLQIEKDLRYAELIALPLTLIILLFVFRSVFAAMLPLVVGIYTILGGLAMLYVITRFTTVTIYSLNLATMLGLGLAIDYSLFIVSRFREELSKGLATKDAVRATVMTAGRTVTFSALTVTISLAALLLFRQPFLRSFAYAGVAVSLVAASGALILLPAVMTLLGPRVNKFSIGKKVSYEKGSRFWYGVARRVMQRPIIVGVLVIALLVLLGRPFGSLNLGRTDERSLPVNNSARQVHENIRNNFSSRETAALKVVSVESRSFTDSEIAVYAKELSEVATVTHVESSVGIYARGQKIAPPTGVQKNLADKGTWLSVVSDVEPFSSDGEKLTDDVRSLVSPFKVYVGGPSAGLKDLKDSIMDHLPWALAWISLAIFVLMFLMFGSVILPLKALFISLLSLSATFGAMVWIFQEGHLSGILNFSPTGMIDATIPILMFCVAFGLSMDYEVFLLSRIKEHYDKTHNNEESVAVGLEMTGGIVTAAAISISVVFLAFATSGVMLIKLFGLCLAFAVLLDAFIIRGTLVPAFMKLLGKANWWAPKYLNSVYKKFRLGKLD